MAPPNPTVSGESMQSRTAQFQGDDAMWLTVYAVTSTGFPSVATATSEFPDSLGDPEPVRVNGILGAAYSYRYHGSHVEMRVFVVDGDFYEIQGSYPFGSPTTPTARDEVKLSLDSLELSGSAG
jgi:hypothetical protein